MFASRTTTFTRFLKHLLFVRKSYRAQWLRFVSNLTCCVFLSRDMGALVVSIHDDEMNRFIADHSQDHPWSEMQFVSEAKHSLLGACLGVLISLLHAGLDFLGLLKRTLLSGTGAGRCGSTSHLFCFELDCRCAAFCC